MNTVLQDRSSKINHDSIDHVCEQLELGIPVSRWNVMGKVTQIIERLESRGTYCPHYDNMLWDLHDSAKESM